MHGCILEILPLTLKRETFRKNLVYCGKERRTSFVVFVFTHADRQFGNSKPNSKLHMISPRMLQMHFGTVGQQNDVQFIL